MKWNVSQIIMIIFYSTGMVVWTRVGASFSWLGHSKFSFKNKHRESCSKIKPLIFARAACEILVKRCCEIIQSKGFLQRAERPRFNYLLLACSTVQDNGPGDLLSLRLKTRALFLMGQNFVRLRIISNDLRASLYWNLLHAIATCKFVTLPHCFCLRYGEITPATLFYCLENQPVGWKYYFYL